MLQHRVHVTQRAPSASRHGVSLFVTLVTFVAGFLGSCAHPDLDTPKDVEQVVPGMWVEVKGQVTGDGQVSEVDEIEEAPFEEGFSADKVELTAPVPTDVTTDATSFEILGERVAVDGDTEFETEERTVVPRFPVVAGDWVRVKARVKPDGSLFARTIRRMQPRDRFKVLGQVGAPAEENSITVGSLAVQPSRETRVNLLDDAIDDEPGSSDPLQTFLQDEQKAVVFSIRPTPDLMFGGQYMFRGRAEDERDLDRDRKRDKQIFQNEIKLDALWRFNEERSFVFLEGTFGIREQLRRERHEETTYQHRLSRAYVFHALTDVFAVQAGRQDFDEEREWIYDEVLDGVRMHARDGPWSLELSMSAGREHELLEDRNDTEDTFNAIGLLRYHLNPSHFLSGYFVSRTDASDEEFNPLVIGLRSWGRPRYGLRHWIELAAARGEHDSTPIDGYAIDTGVSYVVDAPLRPTLTLGVAYATGRIDNDGDTVAFRQTGLQDNNAKFGGVTSFRYYGEVVDPELSNLVVTTMGAGIRPVRDFSIDVVFHTYHQDEASEDLGESDLDADPEGEHRYLGWEIDLVFGYRYKRWLNAELVLGRFEPDDAFDRDDQDAAHKVQFQLRAKF